MALASAEDEMLSLQTELLPLTAPAKSGPAARSMAPVSAQAVRVPADRSQSEAMRSSTKPMEVMRVRGSAPPGAVPAKGSQLKAMLLSRMQRAVISAQASVREVRTAASPVRSGSTLLEQLRLQVEKTASASAPAIMEVPAAIYRSFRAQWMQMETPIPPVSAPEEIPVAGISRLATKIHQNPWWSASTAV